MEQTTGTLPDAAGGPDAVPGPDATPEPEAPGSAAPDLDAPGPEAPGSAAPSGPSASALRAAQDVRVVFSRLRVRLRQEYDQRELTPSQRSVLARLLAIGDASTSALAATEHVRPQSMAATVAALEERGMVARRPDPADGRRQLVSLTAEGRGYVEGRRRSDEEWITRTLDARFTEDERQALLTGLALLERLARA
ncbi:MarR family winged helix-turn-helix transcriptional regulator [Actinacidiphila sp. DG2A-62]|uniref:MarR family winged helix-turn-helix transcriptional regulator n=1 Tax=Actinacidiphila sp. DG2A-62 TaxID=3108821 RepID=UPI002DB9C559|nr:MarR family winged helix-turn-helix transcriptional regulator [Actinacidiphila sp. DG2A-62]MEC3994851.1 MarR family winged helix-turn-helix transcriptional regulator [Actinacidiphila sp. DG2A-62]